MESDPIHRDGLEREQFLGLLDLEKDWTVEDARSLLTSVESIVLDDPVEAVIERSGAYDIFRKAFARRRDQCQQGQEEDRERWDALHREAEANFQNINKQPFTGDIYDEAFRRINRWRPSHAVLALRSMPGHFGDWYRLDRLTIYGVIDSLCANKASESGEHKEEWEAIAALARREHANFSHAVLGRDGFENFRSVFEEAA